jgi:NAD-dependent dihydropyrimidine dehydrogenase PreA subunit
MVRVRINYAKCVGEKDKICVDLCPVSVFALGKGSRPEPANSEKCIVCRVCAVNCPGQAIEILA